MNLWIIIGVALIVALYTWLRSSPGSTNSKHFKLYKYAIDPKKAPDFSITVFKGDFPKNTTPAFLTYVLPRVFTKRGVKSHQCVGFLRSFSDTFASENFFANRFFKEMIHSIAAKEIPTFVVEQAKALATGQIKLLDDRIVDQTIPATDEDLIGTYEVKDGRVVGYSPNPNFRFFANSGPLELVATIRKVLYSEIENADTDNQESDSGSKQSAS